MIDTHAHIYAEEFDKDLAEVLLRCRKNGVEKILMPNIDEHSIDRLHHVADEYSEQCLPMMGLHPCYVKEHYKSVLDEMLTLFNKRRYYAVGEIGIDLYWDKTTRAIQEDAFRIQLEWAKSLQLPVAIHSRDSLDLTISIVESMQDGNLAGVFHCFNGDEKQGNKIKDIGFYMGIGGVLTYKNSGVDKNVALLDIEHMILETDAPYLSPAPFRGKRNSPEYIPIIAQKLSAIKQMDLEEIQEITNANAKKLFSL